MINFAIFALLALAAIVFMLWPLIRHGRQSMQVDSGRQLRLQTNLGLFQEHMSELEASFSEGRIDQHQFAQLKLELELGLLDDEASREQLAVRRAPWAKWVLLISCLAMVVFALGMYHRQGSSADIGIQQLLQAKQEQDYLSALHQRQPSEQPARALAAALEARLEQRTDHSHYWFLLARTRMDLGEMAPAVEAYRRVLALDPQSSMVMGELAQAIFLRDKNRISGEVQQLAAAAVSLDPENTTALGLLGIGAFEQKDYGAAVNFWQQALTVLGPDAAGGPSLEAGIARARAEAANAGTPLADAASPGLTLTIEVSLAEPLALDPSLPVFVYARAWQGARMPLAITRLTLGDLPASVELTEAMAMSASATLAQAEQIEVVARVSLSGSANAQAGDWQGSLGPLDPRSPPASIQLVIDQILAE